MAKGHPLRIATHNVRGLLGSHANKLQAAVRQWAEMRLDVVCLQETHHTNIQHQCLFERDPRHAPQRVHAQGWRVVAQSWSSSQHFAGGLILVRQGLAAMVDAAPPAALPPNNLRGRFTQCGLRWRGHRLQICNVYVPPGTTAAAAEATS